MKDFFINLISIITPTEMEGPDYTQTPPPSQQLKKPKDVIHNQNTENTVCDLFSVTNFYTVLPTN